MSAAKAPAPERHALLGASSSDRWLHCPPSARLCEGLPDKGRPYAREGTAAHALGALELERAFGLSAMTKRAFALARGRILKEAATAAGEQSSGDTDGAEQDAPRDLQSAVTEYTDLIQDAAARFAGAPTVAVEQQVDYSHIAPEGFGTCDCALIGKAEDGTWELRIYDYKHGKGVPVSAPENTQLLLYALGALRMYELIYPIGRVVMTICQPRLHNTTEWTLGVDELRARGQALIPAAQLAYMGGGERQEGSWCRFCEAGATCGTRARRFTALEDFGYAKPENGAMNDEQIGQTLRIGERLAVWLDTLRDYVTTKLLAGEDFPGWKLVEGRAKRTFTDQTTAFELATANGVQEEMLDVRKPVTLSELEKLMGKKRFGEVMTAVVERQPGKPALAPESDPRPALTAHTAAEDFSAETPQV